MTRFMFLLSCFQMRREISINLKFCLLSVMPPWVCSHVGSPDWCLNLSRNCSSNGCRFIVDKGVICTKKRCPTLEISSDEESLTGVGNLSVHSLMLSQKWNLKRNISSFWGKQLSFSLTLAARNKIIAIHGKDWLSIPPVTSVQSSYQTQCLCLRKCGSYLFFYDSVPWLGTSHYYKLFVSWYLALHILCRISIL